MKDINWRRFAPLGLYLALAAAVAAFGLYIAQQEFSLYVQIALGLVAAGLALFAFMDPARVRKALTGRQARYGSNSLIMVVAFVGILAVINYLAYENPQRWDLTEDAEYTLSKETIETLRSVPQPVEALAFFTANIDPERARGLLDSFQFQSEGRFTYRFIDPVADPILASSSNITQDGTIVFVMGQRQEKVTFASETEMTRALLRMMGENLTVYFLTGHGEFSPEDSGDQGYSQVKQMLAAKNYNVQMLNLLAAPRIPDDARTIVIAGPNKPVTAGELALLDGFLAGGGSLVVLLEPSLLTDFGPEPDLLSDYLLQSWGVAVGDDLVVDLSTNQPFTAFSASYSSQHLVTSRMNRLGSAFPTARSVSSATGPQEVLVDELVYTSPNSWAETDLVALEGGQQIQPDEGQDRMGPVALAVAAENIASDARLVVFGDAEFANNTSFSYLGNGDLLLNAVDWVSEQETLINLTPKASTQRMLLPSTTLTKGLITLGAVFLPSGLVIAGGIAAFVSRRKRG
jgi:ABC-type uncharacterized transport system involved in gliding motility auxiliary subunit